MRRCACCARVLKVLSPHVNSEQILMPISPEKRRKVSGATTTQAPSTPSESVLRFDEPPRLIPLNCTRSPYDQVPGFVLYVHVLPDTLLLYIIIFSAVTTCCCCIPSTRVHPWYTTARCTSMYLVPGTCQYVQATWWLFCRSTRGSVKRHRGPSSMQAADGKKILYGTN